MEEEIKSELEKAGFSIGDPTVLQRCMTFCINYKLSPSDLVSNWEVYYLNRHLSELRIEEDHMEGFLFYLQNDMKDRTMKEEPNIHVYSSNDLDMLLNGEPENVIDGIVNTPDSHPKSFDLLSTPTNRRPSSKKESENRVTPFGQRVSKFVHQFTLVANSESGEGGKAEVTQDSEMMEDGVIRRVQPSERCPLQIHSSQPKPGCKFMYDRIDGRFDFLENRIKRHTNAFAASGLYGEPTDPTWASQTSLFTVGMVCCDGEGHLNENSVLLQGSVEHTGGQRVRLDLQKVPKFSLFPGQVVGIDGHNPSGHCLIASEIIDFLPNSSNADAPPAKKLALDNGNEQSIHSAASRMLSMILAAGPFTTTDNLLFEPLVELLAYASRRQTQLLILMGPFIDSEHPEIKKGTVDRSFDDIFHDEILRKLQDHTGFMGSSVRVVLVPSTRDAHHDFVFPQPAFDIHLPDDATHQISCFANPIVFGANEIMVGCCTVDILKQLSGEEISRTPAAAAPPDRMARLATHILRQRSFYPLYPPSVSVPMDFSLAPEALEVSSVPDLLILPSDLAPFVKLLSIGEEQNDEAVKRCLCVNPGRLAKGIGGGTFVELNFNQVPDRSSAIIIRV